MPKVSSHQVGGQIGVVVMLITAIDLIFGLSVANRVVQENKLVVDQSDATRVFNTAETGVDEALNQIYQYEAGQIPSLPSGDISNNALNQVSISTTQGYEGYLNQGENLRIDVANTTGTIKINWSKNACNATYKTAVLLTLVHLSGSEYQNHYYLVGAGDCLYSSNQNFISPIAADSPFQYAHNLTIDSSNNNDATLYIQAVGSGTDLQVNASANLISSSQYKIESLAKSESDISNKTIEANKSLPSAPSFMTFALFSGGTIVK
jgi:Tfp pilus assembly protein PilX